MLEGDYYQFKSWLTHYELNHESVRYLFLELISRIPSNINKQLKKGDGYIDKRVIQEPSELKKKELNWINFWGQGQIEYYLLLIFSIEALLKIIALGLVMHPHSYLRSVWNMLDFVVVVSGIVTLFVIKEGEKVNVKALRAVRVLRPLKLISGIPSLQVVMTSIVRAMLPLLQVLFLVVFVIIIYAIIGLEFYGNRFHHGCFNATSKSFSEEEKDRPCDPWVNKSKGYFVSGRKCPAGLVCQKYVEGINYGISAFDNIFLSFITVFQCITMEGWTDIMYHTFDVMDEEGYIFSLYYISLIVLGSFFMLNLVLGVLSGEFAKEREKVENRRNFIKLRYEQQLKRMCNSYLEWILKGEDALVQEQSAQNIVQVSEAITDVSHSVIANPALVFTSSRNYRVNIGDNHKSKLERFKLYIKSSRIKMRAIVKHQYFFWLVVVMVFINTVIMATRHYHQPVWLGDLQDAAEIIFVTIFSIELLIKLFAFGIVGYCHSLFNIFDLIVVVLSIMERVVRSLISVNLGLSVLRCLRLLKVFKVTKYWSSLRNLVASLMNAMKSILSLMFLLFLFIVILALLGMQLFGGKFYKLKVYPRTNFDSISDSLLAVFQVITGEDWNVVMYNGIMSYGGPKTVSGVCFAFYFIFLVIFGNYTLLNVFLAIAVDNLTNAEILTHDEEAEEKEKQIDKLTRFLASDQDLANKAMTFVNTLHSQTVSANDSADAESNNENDGEEDDLYDSSDSPKSPHQNGHANGEIPSNNSTNGPVVIIQSPPSPGLSPPVYQQVSMEPRRSMDGNNLPFTNRQSPDQYRDVQRKWKKIVQYSSSNPSMFLNIDKHVELPRRGSAASTVSFGSDDQNMESQNEDNSDEDISSRIRDDGILKVLKVNVNQRRRIAPSVPMIQKSSLFIFSPNNRFRMLVHRFVHYRYFDWFIMLIIGMSTISLALENPVDQQAPVNLTLDYFDYVFTAVFGLEVILKVIDCGFILHKGSYLRNPWNVLDAFVFACNLASIIIVSSESAPNKVIETLRVLRVLRPLKAIHKVKKLKAVFQCMVYSLKNVAFVLIITAFILFIFACIGVQLFQGKFYVCTDQSKMTREECQGKYYVFPDTDSVNRNTPQVRDRIWKKKEFHFDNILDAFFTLYACSTGEGWPGSMHHAMDATKVDEGPITNNNPLMAIYYIVFVVIFTFMIINIYIALIILTFQRQGEKEIEGGLDRNQRDCLQFVLTANPRQRYMPSDKSSLTYRVWVVVDSEPFEYFIMALIVLNTVQLMMKYTEATEAYKSVLFAFNVAFTCLFCIEAALKIIAYRQNYFKDLWNLFDLLVILGSLADIILLASNELTKFMDPTMFRLCRTARIVKLLRKGQSIRIMLWTFVQSFKALPYVTALIILLLYIYAIAGMQAFGNLELGAVGDDMINYHNNFRSILPALQVLFRSSTGESWNMVMFECAKRLCQVGDSNDIPWSCPHKWVSYLYFSSFIFFCFFLLLNLFVAVIMDNFEYLTRDSSILGPHHLDEFVGCWSEFDPQATGKIPHMLLYKMLCRLTPPVGFGKKCPKHFAYKRLIKMNMPVDEDGAVSFHTTLLALIRTSLNVFCQGNMYENDKELRRVIRSIWPKAADKNLEKAMPKIHSGNGVQMTVGKIYCVKLMVMKYRNKAGRSNPNEQPVKEEPQSVFERINSLLPSSFRRRKLSSRKSNERKKVKKQHENIKRTQTFADGASRSKRSNTHIRCLSV